jgi:hypothetical protein
MALCLQAIIAPLIGWWGGAAFAAAFFIGREIAQAEYRSIVSHYGNRRANAPWWVGFERRAWTRKGLADFILPTAAVAAVAFVVGGR